MKELVLASNNQGKIYEIKYLLDNVNLLSLNDIGFTGEIPEPYDSFEENAFAKASHIFEYCGKNVVADDSGLCVNALNGAPGVISAHYSGIRDDEQNLQKVLNEIKDMADRSAYYKAVICLVWEGNSYFFEGICHGKILDEKHGEMGFGYDPVFVPEGYTETFAQLPLKIKNEISHRGKAIRKMIAFLKEKNNNTDEIFNWG